MTLQKNSNYIQIHAAGTSSSRYQSNEKNNRPFQDNSFRMERRYKILESF